MDNIAETDSPPGSSGLWTFVFIDMMVFFMFFTVYVTERHRLPDVFLESQHKLSVVVGLLSTVALLTSSWCMAEAVRAARDRSAARVSRWLDCAIVLALVFVANKLLEYSDKVSLGISPLSNSFFTFYFLITGIHFLHVMGGLVFMTHCRARADAEVRDAAFLVKLENVGLFWHFVDVLWLFIFPMIYLTELVGQ